MNSTENYFYGPQNYNKLNNTLDDIGDEIEDINESISDINDDIGDVNTAIETISGDITTINNKLAEVKSYYFTYPFETIAISKKNADSGIPGSAQINITVPTGYSLLAIIVNTVNISADQYLDTEYWKVYYQVNKESRWVKFYNPTTSNIGLQVALICIFEKN